MKSTDTAPATVLGRCSGLLQEDLEYHQSTGYDILLECWELADKLGLHAIAADCEWALAKLWQKKEVSMRAAEVLSQDAMHRITRSAHTGCHAVHRALLEVHARDGWVGRSDLEQLIAYLHEVAPAQTMLEWRMGKDG